jgi:hypothetical protein
VARVLPAPLAQMGCFLASCPNGKQPKSELRKTLEKTGEFHPSVGEWKTVFIAKK